nr:unnamed protein product [Callosobruchus chinensis]
MQRSPVVTPRDFLSPGQHSADITADNLEKDLKDLLSQKDLTATLAEDLLKHFSSEGTDVKEEADCSNSNDIEDFTKAINQAIDISTPKIKQMDNKIPVPWWNDDCKIAIKKRKQAINKFKSHPNTCNFIEYKKVKAHARRIIRLARENSWKTFTSEINPKTSTQEIWKSVKKLRGIPCATVTMLKNADTIITDNIELAETFANHFHESFSGYVDEPFPILNETQEKNQYNLPITYRELIDALHRLD